MRPSRVVSPVSRLRRRPRRSHAHTETAVGAVPLPSPCGTARSIPGWDTAGRPTTVPGHRNRRPASWVDRGGPPRPPGGRVPPSGSHGPHGQRLHRRGDADRVGPSPCFLTGTWEKGGCAARWLMPCPGRTARSQACEVAEGRVRAPSRTAPPQDTEDVVGSVTGTSFEQGAAVAPGRPPRRYGPHSSQSSRGGGMLMSNGRVIDEPVGRWGLDRAVPRTGHRRSAGCHGVPRPPDVGVRRASATPTSWRRPSR